MVKDISPTVVRSLLDYDPDAGSLVWRFRTREWFNSDHEYERWNTRYAGRLAGHKDSKGYIKLKIAGVSFFAHRIIWAHVHGCDLYHNIDHVNHDPSDNRIHNLRCVSQSCNMKNMRKTRANTSGITGVSFNRKRLKWQAYISLNGRLTHLGYFDTLDAAAIRRRIAEIAANFHPNHGK